MPHRSHKWTLSCKEHFPDWVISSAHSSPPMTQCSLWCFSRVPAAPWFSYQSPHTYFSPLELGSQWMLYEDLMSNGALPSGPLFESCCAVQSALKLKILLAEPPKCWDYRQVPPHPAWLLPSHSSQTCYSFNFWGHGNTLCWLPVGALGLELTLDLFLMSPSKRLIM